MKNAFRNTTRTVAIVLILSVTFALALVMLVSNQAASQRVASVSSSVGTTITVTPAGQAGFGGGGNPLTTADVAKILATPHVAAAAVSVSDRLSNSSAANQSGPGGFPSRFGTGGTTSLASPIAPGQLGRRFGGGAGFQLPANFQLPVQVTGTNDPLNPAVLNATTVKLASGTEIDGASTALVADVGANLATKNKLTVGSTFAAYGKSIKVLGIFSANTKIADAMFVLPLKTAQSLSGIAGVTTVTVTVDNVSNVAATSAALQSTLGTSVADVTTGQQGTAAVASSLASIKTITVFSLIGALIAAAAILLMSMLMIVRERRREIGILKAFGSSNGGVVATFITEALTITGLAAVLGSVLGVAMSNPVLSVLVNNTRTTSSGVRGFTFGGGPPGGFGGPNFRNFGFGGNALGNLHAALGTSTALYAVGIAVAIALLGSAVPAYAIAKVRPAEVMRSE